MNPLAPILRASADYYNGSPSLTDTEYDALVADLAKRMPSLYDQWRASYIGPKPAFATPHPHKMLSLRGAGWDRFPEFAEWLADMPKAASYLIQPKVDGHAVSITYTAGRLTRVATRGDGAVGKDITGLVLKNKLLPLVIPSPAVEPLHLTGEIFIPLASWNAEDFSHPRNELNSVINGYHSPKRSALQILIHGVPAWPAEKLAQTESEVFDYLSGRVGLPVVKTFTADRRLLVSKFGETLHGYVDHYRKSLPIDGLVVKVAEFKLRHKIGDSAVAPLWAYALKEYQTY